MGTICKDGYFWPSYPVLQRLKERRKKTSRWFKVKLFLGITLERRGVE
jgi:hypothetical protein